MASDASEVNLLTFSDRPVCGALCALLKVFVAGGFALSRLPLRLALLGYFRPSHRNQTGRGTVNDAFSLRFTCSRLRIHTRYMAGSLRRSVAVVSDMSDRSFGIAGTDNLLSEVSVKVP